MIVSTPAAEAVQGHAAQMYADDVAEDGFVYAHTAVMAMNPEVHAAFEALVRAVIPSIGLRTYELATLGAARAIPSPHCLLAHGRKVLSAGMLDEASMVSVLRGDYSALAPRDEAVLRFAEKVSGEVGLMTDADSEDLRTQGFDDRQIVDIALTAAARNFLSRALRALAVPVDDVPGLSAAMKEEILSTGTPRSLP